MKMDEAYVFVEVYRTVYERTGQYSAAIREARHAVNEFRFINVN